mmetsp:Transcript_10205/g.35502  ORF Transcript_10205/g.35502 Transcript_10205/m.35502 type:complete len:299 (-) Transcript_10205:839-1735(-)
MMSGGHKGGRKGGGGGGPAEMLRKWEVDAFAAVYKVFKVQEGLPSVEWEASRRRETILNELQQELHISHEDKGAMTGAIYDDPKVKHVRDGLGQMPPPHAGGGMMAPSAKRQKLDGGGARAVGGMGRGGVRQRQSGTARKPGKMGAVGGLPGAPVIPPEAGKYIGRKCQRYWPDEGGWYEAVITDYNPADGTHCFVYDAGTPDESFDHQVIAELDPSEFKLIEGTVKLDDIAPPPGALPPNLAEVEARVARAKDASQLDNMKDALRTEEEQLRQELEALGSDSEEDASSEGDTSVSEQ